MAVGGCGPYQWTEIVVGTFLGFLASICAIISSVTFHQCIENGWLDYWLVFHGVITLGTLTGIMVWRLAPIPGRNINAMVYLTGFLIFISLGWLILGNVQIGLAYSVCFGGNSPDVYLNIPLDCDSRFLPLMLSVVIIFDVFFIIFLVMICAQSCKWSPVPKDEDTISYPSRWWLFVTIVIFFLILAVVSIAVGATYLQECYTKDWGAIWLIVFGTTHIIVLVFAVYWIRYRGDVGQMWDSPACYISLPYIAFYLLQLAILGAGKILLFHIREESCNGEDACNDVLQVTEIVVVSIYYFLSLVILYYGAIFFLVCLYFFVITIYYYCSGDSEADADEAAFINRQKV